MKVVITGGGTGGHLSVARAFLEEFSKRGYECVFVGSMGGQDRAYFEEDLRFVRKYFLQTKGVVNQKGFKKIKSLFCHFKAFVESYKILRKERADFVLSVGGYSAAPAAFGAVFLKIPLIIHEQNAKIGRLNSLLKPYAKLFFSSYEESSPLKYYPISKDFFLQARVREGIKNILFLGGSQGARSINDFALKNAQKLKEKGIKIYHQCGKNELERVLLEYQKLSLKTAVLEKIEDLKGDFDVIVFGFSPYMPQVFGACDFAVSRSGASSLWELCANGLVTLFVPYPYAASNHQYFNAKFLVEQNLAFLCEESELEDSTLWEILEKLEANVLKKMSEKVQKECNINATYEITEKIIASL